MKPQPIDGHAEFLKQKNLLYYYVNGKSPSGLKGSKVITPKEQLLLEPLLTEIKIDHLN